MIRPPTRLSGRQRRNRSATITQVKRPGETGVRQRGQLSSVMGWFFALFPKQQARRRFRDPLLRQSPTRHQDEGGPAPMNKDQSQRRDDPQAGRA